MINIDLLSAPGPAGKISEEQSRASMISRRSNTDMKGADLIKVDKNRMGEGSPRGLASKDLGADEE